MKRQVDEAIRHAIKTVIAGFSPFSDVPDYNNFAVIGRERAAFISDKVFETLEADGYLKAGPATDRRLRITLLITHAIGHIGEPPDNQRPGQWREISKRPGWNLDEVVDSIHANLAHRGYI
jgi:hypothetical protein